MSVAVGSAKRIQRDGTLRPLRQAVDVVGRKGGFVVRHAIETGQRRVIPELLPWAEATRMGRMENHAEAFVRRHANRDADEEERPDE